LEIVAPFNKSTFQSRRGNSSIVSTKVRELGSVYCSSRGGTEEVTIVVCSYYDDVAGVEQAKVYG